MIFNTKKVRDDAFNKGVNFGIQKEQENREQQRKGFEIYECQQYVGKYIISISNQYDNIIVGYGNEVHFVTKGLCPILEFTDVVSGRSMYANGVTMVYTEQKFDALNDMDREALIAILYAKNGDHEVKDIEPSSGEAEFVNVEEWKKIVKEKINEHKLNQECYNSLMV
jgi:hypothetical protein